MWVVGVDLGGTGGRAALAQNEHVVARASLDGVVDKVHAVRDLLSQLPAPSNVDAIAVGSTGFAMLGAQLRAGVPTIAWQHGAQALLLSSDMLTSYAGALGLAPGAVVAAGTGAVALGSDLRGNWSRVDGWGHLLGDHGGGSWIGRMALQAALRQDDGRPGGSLPLLRALRSHFGEPAELVALLASRADRAGLMAGFVPAVVAAADSGDVVAAAILDQAGVHLAETASAAVPAAGIVATTGNLFQVRPVREAFMRELAGKVQVRPAIGSSVDGALLLARAMLTSTVPLGAPCEQFTPPSRVP